MSQTSEESNTVEIHQQLETINPDQLQRLLQISMTLSSTLDLKQLLIMVLDTVTDLTDTEHASILLMDGATNNLFVAATSGPGLAEESIVPLEGSMAGWIVRNGQPLILDDLQKSSQSYVDLDSTGQYVTRNMLGVPLVTKGKVIGALEVINKRERATYGQQDIALLQALASQAAIAIENARLFQQTDLISEFMHELKTPLMALTAASELLAREEIEDKQQELIDMLQRETARLSRMAQDFLDLARLESGRAQIAQEPVNVAELVDDVVQLQEAQASARDITITVVVPKKTPFTLGDHDLLKQVLLNLTNNAIKYNYPGGRVVIEVGLLGEEVMITIADTGPGITKENLPHLFERFFRIPDSEGFTEGTGLGLSISARIVKEHGGRIEVESEEGQGSVFRCYLPVLKQ